MEYNHSEPIATELKHNPPIYYNNKNTMENNDSQNATEQGGQHNEGGPESRQLANKRALKSVADGIAFFKAGKFDDAYNSLNNALRIDPQNVEGLTARGALYANKGNYSKAITDFEAVLKVNPNHVNAKKYLGQTLVARGRSFEEEKKFEEAMMSYEACLNVVPYHEEATKSLKYLRELQSDELDLTSSLPPLNISGGVGNKVQASLKQFMTEEKDGKKKKEKKKKKQQEVSSSSSDSSSDLSSSDSSDSSSDSDSSQDSTTKKKKKKKKNKESLSPTKRLSAGNGMAARYSGNTSGNFMDLFNNSANQVQNAKSSEAEYDLRVAEFLEQTKGDNDYEEKVRKFLEETAKWKKEQRQKEKKRRKKEKKIKDKVKRKKKEEKRKRKLEEKKLKDTKTGLTIGMTELQNIQSKISEFYNRMNQPQSPPAKKKELVAKKTRDQSSSSSSSEEEKSPPRKKVDMFADSPPGKKTDPTKFKMQISGKSKKELKTKENWSDDDEEKKEKKKASLGAAPEAKKRKESESDSDSAPDKKKRRPQKRESQSSSRSRSRKRSRSRSRSRSSSSSSYSRKRSYRKRYRSSDSRSRSRSDHSRSRSYSRSRSRSYSPNKHGSSSRGHHRGGMNNRGTYYKPRPYYNPRGGYIPRGRGRGAPGYINNYRGRGGPYIPRGRGVYNNYNNGHSRPRYFHYKPRDTRDQGGYYNKYEGGDGKYQGGGRYEGGGTRYEGGGRYEKYEKRPRSPRDEEYDDSPRRGASEKKIEKHASGPLSDGEERDDDM